MTNNQQPTPEEDIQNIRDAIYHSKRPNGAGASLDRILSSLGSQPLKSMEEFTKELENEGHGPLLEKGREWLAQKMSSQTDVEIREAVSLLRNFVSDRSKFGGETIDSAISLLCDVAERGLLKTGER